MSPALVPLSSDDADVPLYMDQQSSIPKIGEGLLRTVRSFGDRLSEVGSDEPAFVMPSWTIPSKSSSAGLGHYFEGDNSSTPSCLSPRSVHSTDNGDENCQVETSLSAWDMQKKLADRSVDALRIRLIH